MGYWVQKDFDLVDSDDRSLTLTIAEHGTGNPVSITTWSFEFKARLRSDTTVTYTVANAATTQSDSGQGVTDTVTIPLDGDDSSIVPGRWDYQVVVTISGEETTILRGTITVPERL